MRTVPAPPVAARRSEALTGAVAAEWTRLVSIRTTWWTLLAGVLLMAATSAQLAIYVQNSNTSADPTDDRGVVTVGSVLIDALDLTQYAVLALGLLAVTSEYAPAPSAPP